jgi:hypothetical protein
MASAAVARKIFMSFLAIPGLCPFGVVEAVAQHLS